MMEIRLVLKIRGIRRVLEDDDSLTPAPTGPKIRPMIPKRLLRRLSVRQLQEAIHQKKRMDRVTQLDRQLEHHQREAAKLRRKIERLMGSSPDGAKHAKRRKRRLSAAGKRRIGEAASRRWAKFRAAAGKRTAAPKQDKPRRFSAEALKRISEAAKRRWAEFRAKKEAQGQS